MALLAIGVLLFVTSNFLTGDTDYVRLGVGIACGLLSSFVKTYIDMNQ